LKFWINGGTSNVTTTYHGKIYGLWPPG